MYVLGVKGNAPYGFDTGIVLEHLPVDLYCRAGLQRNNGTSTSQQRVLQYCSSEYTTCTEYCRIAMRNTCIATIVRRTNVGIRGLEHSECHGTFVRTCERGKT